MNLSELKSQVEDLKLMLLEPKLYVKKYFEDLINQLDIQTIKFKIKKETGDSKDNSSKINEDVENWRQLIKKKLEQEELELLNKLTSEFKIDAELTQQAENIIKQITEEFSSENHVVSVDRLNKLEEKVYGYSIQIKRNIMSNRCFVVLSKAKAGELKYLNIDSIDLWQNILPIVSIDEGFIDTKGQNFLNNLGESKEEYISLNKETMTVLLVKNYISFLSISVHDDLIIKTNLLPDFNICTVKTSLSSNYGKLSLTDYKIRNLSKEAFEGLDEFYTLDLSNNQIESIAPNSFTYLNHIETLYLHDNKIKHLNKDTFEGLNMLKTLSLENNQIESIEPNSFACLNQLRGLDLQGNEINNLCKEAFEGLSELRELYLHKNQIESITLNIFSCLNLLGDLRLSENKLKHLEKGTFEGLKNLTNLTLVNNQIESIAPNSFDCLNLLGTLDLSGNKLKHLDKGTFEGLEDLIFLDLKDNQLELIEKNSFSCLNKLDNLKIVQ